MQSFIAFIIFSRAKISDFLANCKHTPQFERLSELFKLDTQLSQWQNSLHPYLAYSKTRLYEHLKVLDNVNYVFLHALYYQCLLVLHSAIVPQFSGLTGDFSQSKELINTSARIALKSAKNISALAADLLSLNWDFSRVAPFLGYCIYASSSILVVFFYTGKQDKSCLCRRRLSSNLRALGLMRDYWGYLEQLVSTCLWQNFVYVSSYCETLQQTRIQILFDSRPAQMSFASRDRSPDVDVNERHTPDETTEGHTIKFVADVPRNIQPLQEPLADSMLEYGLHLRTHDEAFRPNISAPKHRCDGFTALADQIERAESVEVSNPSLRITEQETVQQHKHPSVTTDSHLGATSEISLEVLGQDDVFSAEQGNLGFHNQEAELTFFSDPAWKILQDRNGSWPFVSPEDQMDDLWQMGLDTLEVED